MFVRVTPQVYPHYVRSSRIDQPKQTKAAGWQITVIAMPVMGTYYDIKVQMVMKGVGAAGSTIEVPDILPGPTPNVFTATTDELGKEAVVCYTARAASQSPQRWTGTFTIQSGSTPGMSAFVAAHEPTLEKASDTPCGGLKAIKAVASPPVESSEAPDTQNPRVNSGKLPWRWRVVRNNFNRISECGQFKLAIPSYISILVLRLFAFCWN
jgi:hypothetical protein